MTEHHHHHSHFPHPEHPWDHPCAPECDDQLAVFSRIARGMRGDGFKVIIKSDEEAETYLEGLSYDPNTGTYNSEWITGNINGGKLMYQYNLRPYTNPQTFTITFRYKRPDRSESEWVWTTPAIPYIWDADNDGHADVDGIVGTGVAALFLKKTTEPQWYFPTVTYTDYKNGLMTSAKHDKIVYPDGWTREMFNAPIPGDPWSVNLQYGIGGDLDAPNIDDLAKVIGVSVDFIRELVLQRQLPEAGDVFGYDAQGNPLNVKEYIEKGDADVLNHIHQDMGFGTILINDGDSDTANPKRNTIKKWFDWIIGKLGFGTNIDNFGGHGSTIKQYIDYLTQDPIAGNGISIVKNSSGRNVISAKLIGGAGIQTSVNSDGSISIINTTVDGRWTRLTEGVDFEYKYHNGWYVGHAQEANAQTSNPSYIVGPGVYVIPSYSTDGSTITGAQVRINSGGNSLVNKNDMLDTSNFLFRHSDSVVQCPQSAIVSISFKGAYANLNNLSVKKVEPGPNNIWNISGTDDSIRSDSADWTNCGASWEVSCSLQKNVGLSGSKVFMLSATSIADGYNSQYSRPDYNYAHLCVRPWANFDWYMTLG